MADANTIQTNFTAGEISPLMYGRVDVNKYFNGARKLRNLICVPQGGAIRRPGTKFVVATKDSTKKSRLVRFCFNNDQSYQLEFGEGYIRFLKSRVQVTSASVPVEVVTPYLEADLPKLVFAQSADVVYITHPSYPVKKLNRFSDTSWTLTTPTFFDGPYLNSVDDGSKAQVTLVTDITSLTIHGNLATSGLNALSSIAIFSNSPTSVGKYVEYVVSVGPTWKWNLLLVTAFTSTTAVTVSIPAFTYLYPPTTTTVTASGGTLTASTKLFGTQSVGKYIRLTGSQAWYLITAVNANGFTASGTALTLVAYTGSFSSTTGALSGTTVTVTNGIQFAVGDVGKYVEYRENGRWHLAVISAYLSQTAVQVTVVDNILLPSLTAKVTLTSSQANSDLSGIFAPSDIGKCVRSSVSQAWSRITSYNNSSQVIATPLTLFSYVYPNVIADLQVDRVITVTCQFGADQLDVGDIGRLVRLRFGSVWRILTITGISSPSQCQGTFNSYVPFDPDTPTTIYSNGFADEFKLSAWSSVTGYPSVCCFHQGRLGFGRTTSQPTTFWLSESDDYESFSPTDLSTLVVLDSNAITETIAYSQLNPIVWMQSGPVLLVGTGGVEFQVKPSNINAALTPTNISVLPQTQFGAIDPDPAYRINSQTLFIQRGGVKLREMAYEFQIDSFVSKDISIISEHLARLHGGMVSATIMHNPHTVVWIVMGDGMLVGMTYEREQDVIAWHPHLIGGSTGPSSFGIVESVCCIPSASASDQDELYVIVKRTINGATKRYIEVMERIPTPATTVDFANNYYVDCGITFTQASALKTTLSGLSHLEGCPVQVVVDGWYQGVRTVSSGSITINKVCTTIHAGLQSNSVLQILDPEGGSSKGTSQGKFKRMVSIVARVLNTMNTFKQGPSETELHRIEPQVVETVPATTAVPDPGVMVTDDLFFAVDDGFENGGRVFLVMDDPYPFNVIALMPEMVVNDD